MKQKLMLKSEKYDIPAIFTLPETDGRLPCVIMCHGTGSSKDEAGNQYVDLADKLARKGVASIRFDFAVVKAQTQASTRPLWPKSLTL